MEITEIRIKLVESSSDKLRAFCSITIDDCFVIRDLKIIDGTKGAFVAMPSRKLTTRCRRCSCKNQTRAKFCNECGSKIPQGGSSEDDSRAKLHADIAHPINSECRERLQSQVLEEFYAELEGSEEADYESNAQETGKSEYIEDEEDEGEGEEQYEENEENEEEYEEEDEASEEEGDYEEEDEASEEEGEASEEEGDYEEEDEASEEEGDYDDEE
ncbi:MAG: SpoVG family protein, partial [Planctomycetota bacterium]